MTSCVGLVLSATCLLLLSTECRAAGRAFPVDAENYVIERFQTINSRLEWDESNFLVDLSGHYASCRSVGRSGHVTVDRRTPDGESISGITDSVEGERADGRSVTGYIKTIIDRWVNYGTYNNVLRNARQFGCSVRPACSGRTMITCLFSPGSDDHQNEQPEENAVQDALAFTAEQYRTAERFTSNSWDRSYLLENLSGYETNCEMIDNDDWPFNKVRLIAQERGLRFTPVYGVARNLGSTDAALGSILQNFKKVHSASALGCSIIPDCIRDQEMFVVVSCLYKME